MNALKNKVQRFRQFLRPAVWSAAATARDRARLPPPRFIDCMELEDRTLFSATPLGVETLVNTATPDSQQTFAETPQAVASDANGNYVVAWSSLNQDGAGWGIYAQRFNSAGVAQGSEIQVNTSTGTNEQYAAVAMDADGDFVVVWSTDASGDAGVRAQRFNASGVAQGGEIAVNAYTADDQTWASVAMDDNGNFVITWSSINQDGGGWGIYAERFTAAGVGQGDFLVNTTTAGDQMHSQVAMDADGDFVITWETDLQLGTGFGVFGRRYDSSGAAQGGEFLINTATAGDQRRSAVAMDAAGNFVVTWTSAGQDGSGGGIYGQRFNSSGGMVGGEFLVNATTSGNQDYSSISMSGSGDFVITWSSFDQDAAGTWGVYAQKYTAAGAVEEAEFSVNSTTASNQQFSGVAITPNNTAVFVWSGNGASDGDGVFMQRYNFNDAPIVSTTPGALAYVENAGAVAVDTGVVVSDSDNASLTGATITISGNYINGQDALAFTDQNGITGNWNAGTGTLTLSGVSSVTNYQTALRSITYTNNSDIPSTAIRTVSFAVSDVTSTSSAATRDITIGAVNDAPILAGIEGAALAYIENGSTLVTSSITVADADHAALTSATVQVTGNYVLGQDVLTFTNTATITGVWDGASGTLTLTGADSLANYQAALRSVRYVNASDDPNTATRTVSFRVSDGTANSNTQTRDITVAAVNDAPQVNIPGPQNTGEDTPLVFSGGVGNAISMSDADAGANLVQVTLTAASGTMTLSQTTGLGFITGDGTTDGSMSFTGSVAAINAALDGLTFTPASDFVGAASIHIAADDLANSGAGGALTDSDTISITVGAANDAPLNAVPGPQTTNEDTLLTFSSGSGNQISISDLDAGVNPMQVTLTAAGGTATLSQTTGLSFSTGDGATDAVMTFSGTIAAINAALDGLMFTPAANVSGQASLQILTNDQGNVGLGGAMFASDTIIINVAAIDDAPVISAPLAQVTSGATVTFSAAQGNAITLIDVDAGGAVYELVLNGANGTMSLATTSGVTLIEGTGSGDSRLVLRGTLAELNQALEGMSFAPTTLSAQLSIGLGDLSGGGGSTVSQVVDIGHTLAPPPPTSQEPPGDGNADGNENGSSNNDSDSAEQADGGDASSTPAVVAPPPRRLDSADLDRSSRSGSLVQQASTASLTTDFVPLAQTNRATTSELDTGDDRSQMQGDEMRAKATLVNTSPLLADFSSQTMLFEDLREVHEALESVFASPWTFGAVAGLGALSAGYVLWGLQAGSLVTSALSSLPVWGSFDPLPVLEFWERDSRRKQRDNLDEADALLQSEPPASV